MSSMLLLKVIFLLFDQVLDILGLLLSYLGYGFLSASDVWVSWFCLDVWDSMGGFRTWSWNVWDSMGGFRHKLVFWNDGSS